MITKTIVIYNKMFDTILIIEFEDLWFTYENTNVYEVLGEL